MSHNPYEQIGVEPIKVNVCVSTTLSKTTQILVDDYTTTTCVEAERDKDGHLYKQEDVEYDFSCSSLRRAYENQKFTINELLSYFIVVLTGLIENKKYQLTHSKIAEKDKYSLELEIKRYEDMIESARGWNTDELEVLEE